MGEIGLLAEIAESLGLGGRLAADDKPYEPKRAGQGPLGPGITDLAGPDKATSGEGAAPGWRCAVVGA